MQPGTIRTAAIVFALALGAVLPGASLGEPLIPWLVAAMLFVVFLGTPLHTARIERTHVHLLVANALIAAAAYGAGWLLGGREVALAGFFAGVAPTAAAAPVVVGLLGGRVEFVVAAFLLSNLTVAAGLALLLPWLLGSTGVGGFGAVAMSITAVVAVPMALAAVTRRVHPPAATWPRSLGNASFATWVLTLFLITAKASHYLREDAAGAGRDVVAIALLVAATCAAGFGVGHWLGRPHRAREASQALGQKNTTFTIYLALAHASPLAALGPTFYVLWHNLWNAWNLHRASMPRTPPAAPSPRSTPPAPGS